MKKRLLLGAAYSVIEPLGLLHLAGFARDLGWERKIVLVKEHDFETLFARVPDGHVLAKSYLTSGKPFSFTRLGKETEDHLVGLHNPSAEKILDQIGEFRMQISNLTQFPDEQSCLKDLAAFFGCLPLGEQAAKRFLQYGHERGGLSSKVLSTSTRHHLYDNVLYATDSSNGVSRADEIGLSQARQAQYKV